MTESINDQFQILLLTHSSTDILALESAKRLLPIDFVPIETVDLTELKEDSDMIDILDKKRASESRIVIVVRLLGRGVPGMQHLLDIVHKQHIDLVVVSGIAGSFEPDLTAMCTVNHDVINEVIKYFNADGYALNMANMLRYLADTLLKFGYGYNKPIEQPNHGLYHPRFSDQVEATIEHMKTVVGCNNAKPTVGIIFYRCHFLSGNTSFVDALIDEIEALGLNAIGLFTESLRDDQPCDNVNGKMIERFPTALMHLLDEDGKCLVDVLISSMAFAMGEINPDGPTLGNWATAAIEALNVPVLQAINSVDTRQQWELSARGLSPLDTAM